MELLTQNAELQRSNAHWTIIYIRSGIGMYILNSDLRPINQGDLIILPPKLSYSFCAEELGDEYNINIDAVVLRFDNVWLANLLAVFGTMNKVVLKLREMSDPCAVEGPKWMKLSALLDELSSATATRKAVIIMQILEYISSPEDMIHIDKIAPSQDLSLTEKKDKIERYVTTNLLSKISLEEVAAYLGMNRTYFCMFFKKHYGKGFSDYVNDLRIQKASSLLLHSDRQIAQIALECGFKTAPYFTRAFRRSKRMSPVEYRKLHKDR